jgi:Do/DeqQ family serine protease
MEAMKSRSFIGGAVLVLIGILIGAFVAALVGRQTDRSAGVEGNRVVESIRVGNPDYEYPSGAIQAVGLNTLFKDVARLVRPAVVSIHSGDSFTEEFQRVHPGMPRFHGSTGSGVIVSDAGYIVTNYHVVAEAQDLKVVLLDKREFDGTVVGKDPTTDLAVVRIEEASDLPVIALGNSDGIDVGDWVLAVGNPFRLTSTVTAGIVSAVGRDVNIIKDSFGIEDFIQTDAAINPGNSGGALVSLDGRLVGINTAIATQDGAYEGYGFAVPVNLMAHVVSDLIAYGEVKRGYLGIGMAHMDAARAEEYGLDVIRGVLINDVAEGGAASRYGLRKGDVILAIDGRPIDAINALQSRIATKRPGDVIQLEIWRDQEAKTVEVTLVNRDDESIRRWVLGLTEPELTEELPPETMEASAWGIGFRTLAEEEIQAFGVREGAYIGYIVRGSTASENGVPRDVVITEIEGQPVRSADDAITYLDLAIAREKESVLVRVERRDGIAAFYEIDVPGLE